MIYLATLAAPVFYNANIDEQIMINLNCQRLVHMIEKKVEARSSLEKGLGRLQGSEG